MRAKIELTTFSTHDLVEIKRDLNRWQSPEKFSGTVTELCDRVTPAEFFNIPALGFLRDAWTLGRFGILSGCDAVQLAADEAFPDGRVRVGITVQDIEITEALMPDRRRGQEFAPGAPTLREDPGSEWDRRLDALPSVLERAINRKVQKSYGTNPTLVVYLNVSAYRHRDIEMRDAIEKIKLRFSSKFSALHIIWQGELL